METNISNPNPNNPIPPTTPLPLKHFSKLLIIFIVLAVMTLAGLLTLFFAKKKNNNPAVVPIHPYLKAIPTDVIKEGLLKDAKLPFPDYSVSLEKLNSSQLPIGLKPFVLNESINTVIHKVKYKTSTPTPDGLNISYYLRECNLLTVAQKLNAVAKDWQRIGGKVTPGVFGFMEIKNEDNQIRINYSQKSITMCQVELLTAQIRK